MSPTCRSRSTTACASDRSRSSRCHRPSNDRTARLSSGPATRDRRSRRPRRSIGTSTGPATRSRKSMAINDSVDWLADLGGGTRVALIQAGTFRSDAGALFGPVPRILWDRLVVDEIDHDHRLLQALNCLLVETPAGRVLIETGIGERVSDKVREMRGYQGLS